MEQKYCSNCGTQLDETTAFCSGCGTPVSNSEPINQEPNPVQEPTFNYEQVQNVDTTPTPTPIPVTEDHPDTTSTPIPTPVTEERPDTTASAPNTNSGSEQPYNQYSYTDNYSQTQNQYTPPNYSQQEQGYSSNPQNPNAGMNSPYNHNTSGNSGSQAMAITAMVFGIVGLLLSCIMIGGLFGLIGAILGIIVLVKQKPGKPFAIAGIITSVISILVTIYFIFVFAATYTTIRDEIDIYDDTYDYWNDDDYEDDYDDDYDSDTTNSSPGTKQDGAYTEGVYLVGTDLPAGEYLLDASTSDYGAYLELASDTSDSIDSIITNENFDNRCYITVSDGQYFKFDRCTAKPVADTSPYEAEAGKYPAGMYKVGVDIPAGEYTVTPQEDTYTGSGSYIIYSSSTCDFDDMLEIENIKKDTSVALKDGTYIFMSYAYIQVAQ